MQLNAVRWPTFFATRKIALLGIALQKDIFAVRDGTTPGVPWRIA
jgi:hypothetical protein